MGFTWLETIVILDIATDVMLVFAVLMVIIHINIMFPWTKGKDNTSHKQEDKENGSFDSGTNC